MPFTESFGDILNYGIAPSIRSIGLLCERMDELSFTGDTLECMGEGVDRRAEKPLRVNGT